MKSSEKALHEQIAYLLKQLHCGDVTVHQFMKLLQMTYGDYLEFHPEERPDYYDRDKIDPLFRNHGKQK